MLSAEILREAYKQACLENHNEDFINLLKEELIKKEADQQKQYATQVATFQLEK